MPRSKSKFCKTIEYIGPRPQRAKKSNGGRLGGLVILLIAITITVFFTKPWAGSLFAAQQGVSAEASERVIERLKSSPLLAERVAADALIQSNREIAYDPSYYRISFPNGDVPAKKGVAADLVVRSFRSVGIDLQEEINRDITANFRVYPQLWSASQPDQNIDHRRVPNLHRFFQRNGEELSTSRTVSDYAIGDVVVWALPNAETHIGIVVPGPTDDEAIRWVVHHPAGSHVVWEDALFDQQIIGHFRYDGDEAVSAE